MTRLKGTAWNTTRAIVERHAGKGAVERVLAVLSDTDRKQLSGPILSTSWIDYPTYFKFVIAFDKVCGSGDLEILEMAGAENARLDLGGIYRMFISFVSPNFVIERSAKLWRQYFDTGEMKTVRSGEGFVRLELTEFPDILMHHDVYQLAFMKECVRLSGGKNARGSHPACIARGDDRCIFDLEWDS